MGGFAVWPFWRESVWDFSGLKDIIQVFNQFVILLRSEEKEEAAAYLSEGMRDVTMESGVINKEIKIIFQRVREIIYEDQE